MKKNLILLVLGINLSLSSDNSTAITIKNFHEINSDLYRSAQPNKKEMIQLNQNGFKTVINLRYRINDQSELKETQISENRVRLHAKNLCYNDILKTMKTIKSAPKPILMHCLHGSDRTGCMAAVYRMVFQNWTKDEAIKEFLDPQFGYNSKIFPNILDTLEALDLNRLKRDLITN
jgi:tyrosine-protein phosphatase SIW14